MSSVIPSQHHSSNKTHSAAEWDGTKENVRRVVSPTQITNTERNWVSLTATSDNFSSRLINYCGE